MKVAILYGGKSGEHEVSLRSAASIVRNLDPAHRVTLIGITREGEWRLQPDSALAACRESDGPLALRRDGPEVLVVPARGLRVFGSHGFSDLAVDAVFPVLHGTFGEDGTVQGLLECAGLPYVGADVLGSAVGMDKEAAKALWRDAGLPVLPHVVIRSAEPGAVASARAAVEGSFGWPAFVKPARAGSSVGASSVKSAADFERAAREALRFDTKALVEPFTPAREIECSVIGNASPRAFEPGEIAPTHEFYDYEAKYLDPDGAAILIPAPVDQAVRDRVRELAVRAYSAAMLEGLARVDFFLDKRDGALWLNEVNTLPGFTSISMFPMMCAAGGLPYPRLLDELLSLAVSRKASRDGLSYAHG